MNDESDGVQTSHPDDIPLPPCRPPLEVIQPEDDWLLRTYTSTPTKAVVYDQFRSRIDAIRAAQKRMEAECHPCTLRWDDDDVVGALYWNESFEELAIEHSELLNGWVIVPADGYYVFSYADSIEQAAKAAQRIQRQYDFKYLVVHGANGIERDRYEHRFLRHDIAASGVRFDREQEVVSDPMQPDNSSEEESQKTDTMVSDGINASTLLAAIPDIANLEELSTDGPILTYEAIWGDDQTARILLLDPALAKKKELVDAFSSAMQRWQSVESHESVTPMLDTGPSPAVWLACSAGSGCLAERADALSRDVRLEVVQNIAAAVFAAQKQELYRTVLTPATVRLDAGTDTTKATVSDWALTRAVQSVYGQTQPTAYTPPEELEQRFTPTTPVYRVAAIAYYLICDRPPFIETDELADVIRHDSPTRPSTITNAPADTDRIFAKALRTDPAERYRDPRAFSNQLRTIFE